MRAFELVIAKDAAHAVALLAEHGPSVKVFAGGTDLLVELKSASHVPRVVIDITRAADLKGITVTDRGLRIGALVTHTEIMRSPLIREMFPALVEAAHTIGAVQTRNLATLGGNLVTCVPSVDSGPTLVALDALVTIAGTGGCRQMPLTGFFAGPRRTLLKPEELLVEIVIPTENLGKPADFQKFGLRKGQALALVNAAASLWVDWKRNVCVAPRIALGVRDLSRTQSGEMDAGQDSPACCLRPAARSPRNSAAARRLPLPPGRECRFRNRGTFR